VGACVVGLPGAGGWLDGAFKQPDAKHGVHVENHLQPSIRQQHNYGLLHLYSEFIQSASQYCLTFTRSYTDGGANYKSQTQV